MKNLKLLELLESVLGKGKLTSGDNVAFFSPFTSHYKPKLEINLNTNTDGENNWHCWISNERGRSISSLFKRLNQPKERFDQLERIIKTSRFRNTTIETSTKSKLTLPEDYIPLWVPKTSLDYRAAMHYLKTRGVTIFDILRYRIGYMESGEYRGRICIPSFDSNGDLNYFVTRIFRDRDVMKHKNPNVSKDIIGFEMMINWKEPIILCEGAYDAIAIKRNAIPLFGKHIQKTLQKKIIEERVQDIYICLDRDALRDAVDIAEHFMREGLNVYFVKLEDKDPSEIGFDAITRLISQTTVMQFEDLMKIKLDMLWK